MDSCLGDTEGEDSQEKARDILAIPFRDRITGTDRQAGAARKGNRQCSQRNRTLHPDLLTLDLTPSADSTL